MERWDETESSSHGEKEQNHEAALEERHHRALLSDEEIDRTSSNINEEMAGEFTAGAPVPVSYVPRSESKREDKDAVRDDTGGVALGWVGLVFAIASWFLWPALMGAAAAVLGFIAYRQGAKGLGSWAITIGLIAFALAVVIIPLYRALI
ncbi:hypothetical protein SAMN04487969_10294 [Paenibacillus algorifonticola]|uniref:DUF4190 domain-containing protein n=1 Tax=Paenibacillus algorifonticola TaxID=684063 RepID=A0A1I1ZY51_9BACL|nr:hypothetical protein [Paenibacillus algorifonticola]SFE35380.1 hypothetical protein SAMN04487969_10294 [Paenibacillus algorifonticola]